MNTKSKISSPPQEAAITLGLTLEMWLVAKRLQKKQKLERELAKLERDVKTLKARISALEAAPAEKASSLGLDLGMRLGTKRRNGKQDAEKMERDAKHLRAILRGKDSALEEDVMAQVEKMERETNR
jgi:hypothetical protein